MDPLQLGRVPGGQTEPARPGELDTHPPLLLPRPPRRLASQLPLPQPVANQHLTHPPIIATGYDKTDGPRGPLWTETKFV